MPDGGERVARGCRQARKGVAVCNKAQAAAPTASSTVAAKGARERGAVRPGRGRDRRGPTVATKRPYVVRTGDVTSVRSPAVPGSEDQARSCMCAKAAGQTQSARMQKIGATDPARNETRRGHGRDAACDLRGMLIFRVPAPHGAQTV